MALKLADRVRETTTTAGTGTLTLSGAAPTGYQTFQQGIGSGNTTYYTINANNDWEVGIGTYSTTGPTLTRDTVLASSAGGAKVDFPAGTKDVFVTYPAEKAITDGYGLLPVTNGGTGATTQFTAGSVVFAGASGVYSQDNANLFWDYTNNRLGIGTAGPTYRLDVVAADATAFGYGARLRGNSGYDAATLQFTNNGGTVEQGVVYAGASEMSIRTFDARYLSFWTASNERARIGSNGAFAIGGTGTDASLHIQQAYGGYDRLTQISPSGTSKNAFNIMAAKNGSGGDIWWTWGVTTSNEWTFQPGVNSAMNSSTGIYFTSSAGANKPGGGTWGATSDRRIKTNITPITDAASRIMALKPSSFDYRAPEAHAGRVSDRGFIAQEFEQVYPHGVSESLNICDEEKPFFENGEKLKSVGLNNDFFADLVALVQEQQAIIEDLRARIAALEGK